MQIQLRTLTPIWTGGVDGTSDRLHETGLIGSLRWWYEALVRGLGGFACDPTGNDRCTYDPDQGLASICHACQLFGCTGWRRRFRLTVRPHSKQRTPLFLVSLLQTNRWWLDQVYRPGSQVAFGDLGLSVVPWGDEPAEPVLHALLQLMANGVGIGAKVQHGFGQFGIVGNAAPLTAYAALRQMIEGEAKTTTQDGFARWNELWTLDFSIAATDRLVQDYLRPGNVWVVGDVDAYEDHKDRYIPCAFDIRYKLDQEQGLRQHLRFSKGYGKERARELFGYTSGEDNKQASRIGVSHLFKLRPQDDQYNLRVWGMTADSPQVQRDVEQHIKGMFSTAQVTARHAGETDLRHIREARA